eukprot:CAMPEP_0197536114 /NCGR_PEP_ID=MMETSP1318-20131121/52969_1 /TAXON_ID=552666 /ORGANISM="Partenskyella glossopodia, Strain RCC365" /LENGTH=64 /DNA_ID=CAMNT_0043093905 /DNA_START=60 /DNA_END=250 /DNA_ORIENTATION=+
MVTLLEDGVEKVVEEGMGEIDEPAPQAIEAAKEVEVVVLEVGGMVLLFVFFAVTITFWVLGLTL